MYTEIVERIGENPVSLYDSLSKMSILLSIPKTGRGLKRPAGPRGAAHLRETVGHESGLMTCPGISGVTDKYL